MRFQPAAGRHCRLGIIFALPIEAHAFERLVTDAVSYRGSRLAVSEGSLDGQAVAWTISGVGGIAATRAAQLLIDGHRPERLVAAGFAGGLDPGLARDQLVIPSLLLDGSSSRRPPVPIDLELAEPLWADHPPADASLVTVGEVVGDAIAKQRLREATAASLVDMESYEVATVAATAGLGFLACRVISDAASDTLPREVARLSRPQSAMHRLGAALGAIGRRPRAALEFWRLWEQSLTHSQQLAAGLREVVAAVTAAAGR